MSHLPDAPALPIPLPLPLHTQEASRATPVVEAGSHVLAIDGLRGVAILMVIWFHYIAACGFGADSPVSRFIIGVASSMWIGVDLFFVLSGFLITGILLRAKERPSYFKNFYMRRTLRIFPLYFGALAFIFLLLPQFVAVDTKAVQRIYDTQVWLWMYAQNIAMAVHGEDYFNVEWLWVGHLWSLAVEEHFYLVWPFVVLACSRRGLLFTCLAVIMVTPLIRLCMLANGVWYGSVFVLSFCRADELVFGGLLALLALEPNVSARLAPLARWGIAISSAYFLVVIFGRHKPLDYGHWTMLVPGFSLLAVGFTSLLVFVLAPGTTLLKRVLEHRTLVTVGKYSYGAYMLHTPLEPLCLRLFPPQSIANLASGLGSYTASVVGLMGFTILGTGLVMFLAVLIYHGFERHFLQLKRYFT